jgi:hypothetical protein
VGKRVSLRALALFAAATRITIAFIARPPRSKLTADAVKTLERRLLEMNERLDQTDATLERVQAAQSFQEQLLAAPSRAQPRAPTR